MIIVIIAGGSGTRLWPLSTPGHPKHLLTVDGDELSLLQRTYERARQLTDKIYIVSEAGHIDHVKQQLSELPSENFLVEPARRGTANCIIAAIAAISKSHDPDEAIASIPADHYIRDTEGFKHSLQLASEASVSHKRLVLVGVEPDHPATGFGYIQKGDLLDENGFIFNVGGFKEKPNHDVAVQYLHSGDYLWNCGYFVGSVNTFKRTMRDYAPQLLETYEKLVSAESDQYEQLYLSLASDAIDYALIEKAQDLLVVPASFDWMDIGSFGDLHKAVDSDEQGNHTHGNVITDDVVNSFVRNHEDKPVAVIGLDNVAVINTPDGILVVRKDLAQKVGEVSKRLDQK